MRRARWIEFPPNTLARECGGRELIPATGDFEELFHGSDEMSSFVLPYYVGTPRRAIKRSIPATHAVVSTEVTILKCIGENCIE